MPHIQSRCAAIRDLGHPFAPWRTLKRWSACCEEVAWAAQVRSYVVSRLGAAAAHAQRPGHPPHNRPNRSQGGRVAVTQRGRVLGLRLLA